MVRNESSVFAGRLVSWLVIGAWLQLLAWTQVVAEPIAPFRVTGVEGELAVRFYHDDYDSTYAGLTNSYSYGTTFEEQLDLLVHSYVYHPNLLQMDIGGGPIWFQNRYDSNIGGNTSRDDYFNFNLKANILKEKPYPLVLYYDRNYSSSAPAVQDRVLLKRIKKGLNFSLRRPLVPVMVNFNLGSTISKGGGLERIVDESIDQGSITVSGDLGRNGNGSIGYYRVIDRSRSGTRYLPIDDSTIVTDTVDLQTENLFGDDLEIRFSNYFTFRNQDNLPSLREIRYNPTLNWTHSQVLRSYYRYNYMDQTQEGIDTRSHALDAGFSYLMLDDRLDIAGDAHIDTYDTVGLTQDFYRGRIAVSYLQEFSFFNIRYSGGWNLDYTDRKASVNEVPVFAEHHVLSNTVPVPLANRYVVAGSIVVRNLLQTQTYIEYIDYRVIVDANVTSIQRIPTGNIANGEEVVVDYRYETGGTASFTGFNQHYRIDYLQGEYLNVYARYQNVQQTLVEGQPTLPLESRVARGVGFKLDLPFNETWMVGARGEIEDYDDNVGPYFGRSIGGYVQMPTPLRGKLRVYSDWEVVDKYESPEDIDLVRIGLRYSSRPWQRANLTMDLLSERDTGGTIDRSYTSATLRFDWSVRELKLSAEARYNLDSIGATENKTNRIYIFLTRQF